jgi:penicillin-binding protein 1A
MKAKTIISAAIISACLGILAVVFAFFIIGANLPRLITLEDYKPLVVSEVYSRDGQKVGEFFREKRTVIPFTQIPPMLVKAFISAEDSTFFEHKGINITAIVRAFFANLKAGHSVQGGSTITQQVAKSLMLTREKKLSRKIKEAILSYRMEKNLRKEDILYLYLNQIYLGHGAHGVEAAAQNYFRKHVADLTLAECAILAGLPQAPGRYTPLLAPARAKERQIYVLNRMVDEGYIKKEEAAAAANEPVKVYFREEFQEVAPFYKETVRQFLVAALGETKVLDEGIKIYTTMDLKKQLAAQDSIQKNLRDLDKRQGYRGVARNLKTAEEIAQFLVKQRDELVQKSLPYRIITPDGKEPQRPPLDLTNKAGLGNRPSYIALEQILDGVVTRIDSKWGLVTVRFGESQGIIDIDDMGWARKPDHTKHHTEDVVKDPAKVFTVGDVIQIKVKSDKFASKRIETLLIPKNKNKNKKTPPPPRPPELPVFDEFLALSLEQEPIAQGAILSFDLDTGDVLSMVGGTNFKQNEYNRTIQAARQTGSAFKAIIYAAALEKGFTAATTIVDAPVVYEEGEGQETKKWKPGNFENKFSGDVLFRNAIIKSLNIPTVKILEKISLDWVAKYSRRLGIFSPLNLDYTMALGSSSVTLYEMLKAFSIYSKNGKRVSPILIRKVTDATGEKVLAENISLDEKFRKELETLEAEFNASLAASQATPAPESAAAPVAAASPGASPAEDPNQAFKFADKDQIISPQSAYLITHLLKGVVNEGTGGKARALGRPSAGKTGTTNGYYDAWYVGYTPHVSTGVWVGFDDERPLGKFETGSSAALPIWVDYMSVAVEDTPASDFPVPPGIVFVNMDAETGKLASAQSKRIVREAFREGTEPTQSTSETPDADEKNFFKEDLSN